MTAQFRASLVILALMFAASAFAYALKPTQKLADLHPREKLETLIPMQFGDWRGLPASNIVIADPQMAENLSRIYTETLSRTYVDLRGRQIMLSIAYGEDQRDGMKLHYPEVCYPAQGFQSRSFQIGQMDSPHGPIRVKRLLMAQGQRLEPITYWTMIGEHQSLGGIDKKLTEMRYGFRGTVPDGLLFRVSSIGRETEAAYSVHEEFVGALLGALAPENRKRLAGL